MGANAVRIGLRIAADSPIRVDVMPRHADSQVHFLCSPGSIALDCLQRCERSDDPLSIAGSDIAQRTLEQSPALYTKYGRAKPESPRQIPEDSFGARSACMSGLSVIRLPEVTAGRASFPQRTAAEALDANQLGHVYRSRVTPASPARRCAGVERPFQQDAA